MKFCRTKILATLGPASWSPEMIRKLVENGMDAVRLNCSHSSCEELKRYIQTVREIAHEMKTALPILLDLQGPKIRTGLYQNGEKSVHLKEGEEIQLVGGNEPGHATRISISPESLVAELEVQDLVKLKDGLIQLRVTRIDSSGVWANVVYGGDLPERQGVIVPGKGRSIPSITDRDLQYIDLAAQMEADYIGLSFVRDAKDIRELKSILQGLQADIPVIAKIETQDAVHGIWDILKEADGIMVARGDLAVELSFQQLPWVQKQLVAEAGKSGKLVIVATQMLESMILNPQPTRAEAMDVANSIFDGTDVIMLSGETSVGKYPVETVKMMESISSESEDVLELMRASFMKPTTQAQSLAMACIKIAAELQCQGIVALTHSGLTAQYLSKFKPSVPIFAFTDRARVYNRLNLYWGVISRYIPPLSFPQSRSPVDQLEDFIINELKAYGFPQSSSFCLIGGMPLGIGQVTNFIKIFTLQG